MVVRAAVEGQKTGGSSGQKSHKGRWGAIDAGKDLSDDQVRYN